MHKNISCYEKMDAKFNEVEIFDDFLNENEMNILLKIIETKEWRYGHTSGDDNEKVENKFFSVHNYEDFFIEHIKNKIEKCVSKKMKINRHYMHIQTFGLDGSYHVDDDKKNTYTFCIYISEIDNDEIEESAGEFFIKIPEKNLNNFIMSIEPLMNRGVFFPSNYLHKGMAHNILHSCKRLCITWKLEEIM